MIAKIVVRGKDRKQALDRMREALIETKLRGLATNLSFLRRVVSDAAFAAAEIDTGFIARHQDRLLLPWPDSEIMPSAADPTSPWNDITGWRLNLPPQVPLNLKSEAGEAAVVSGDIKAPMPGKLIDVFVSVGEAVEKGQKLLIMGAMKIEHTMKAPMAGVVRAVHAAAGDQVADKALLVEIE